MLEKRPPIIVIMGHVDHGKSTLLDYIRKSNTVDREAGGITQHVGAYETEIDHNGVKHKITFLDTPGHEAFGGIRGRGVKIADIAILMVSAEDGVKAQTIEALNHIENAKIPYIVAINKIDLPGADIERTKINLAEKGVYLEGYGGQIPNVAISAKKGIAIDDLLDMILLISEMENLTADSSPKATGFVLESNMDSRRGISATILIKEGTLNKGQFIVSGTAIAPVRAIENWNKKQIDNASLSTPVIITGWSEMPPVGEMFETFSTKKEAEAVALKNKGLQNNEATLNNFGDKKIIPIIIKADAMGSIEGIKHEIMKLENERVAIKILSFGTGAVTENDIKSAGSDNQTIILAFNVKTDSPAQSMADRMGITIYSGSIIYKLSEWLEKEVKNKTPKVITNHVTGSAKILKVFSKTKDKQVIGGKVLTGFLRTKGKVRIIRRETEVGSGEILELQQNKMKTSEVSEGSEFGSLIDSRLEIAPGDIVEVIESREE